MCSSDLEEIILKAKEGRLLDGILDADRSDSVAVDFTGKEIVMEVYNQGRTNLIASFSVSGGEITVAVNQIILDKILEKATLPVKKYYFQVFNDTDKIGIAHGLFQVL